MTNTKHYEPFFFFTNSNLHLKNLSYDGTKFMSFYMIDINKASLELFDFSYISFLYDFYLLRIQNKF